MRSGVEVTAGSKPQLNFLLPVHLHDENGWVIAWCPSVDVSSQGKTRETALAAIREAVSAFLESCFARRRLDDALRDCGFTEVHAAQAANHTTDVIEVPMELVINAAANKAGSLAGSC